MKIIVNALGYVGQSEGAGGAGVFLQYLTRHLADFCDVDILVPPNSSDFRAGHNKARLIELPYLRGDTLRRLRVGPTAVLDPLTSLPCADFPEDLGLCVIVHDLMHLERPHFFTARERKERSVGYARALQRADTVIAFSQEQARAIRQFFLGVQATVIPHLPYMAIDSASGTNGLLPDGLDHFVLFPGVRWPHKNHKTLLEAFDIYVRHTGSSLKLVVCGVDCAEHRFSFLPNYAKLSRQIINLGLVNNSTMQALFANAEGIVFPTLYEGFGIPVLEAAYQGKMVAASGLPVFDEILGASSYRRVTDPLCHMRWIDAFADIEGDARRRFEANLQAVHRRVSTQAFMDSFLGVLKECAERYTHPGLYPIRKFPSGDRLTTTPVCGITFSDIYDSATVEKGPRFAAIGHKPASQASVIYRSLDLGTDKRKCLRAHFSAEVDPAVPLCFSAWIKLNDYSSLDALRWSVNDQNSIDLLPMLKDGEWHLFRAPVISKGFIDFRGLRGSQNEVTGYEIEIHNPLVLRVNDLPVPVESPPTLSLTIFVAAFECRTSFADVIESVNTINSALSSAAAAVRWVILAKQKALIAGKSDQLPSNVRVQFAADNILSRAEATGFVSPYEPITRLLLLEATDLAACTTSKNIELMKAALTPGLASNSSLALEPVARGFWLEEERGKVTDVTHRIGEPVPLLDPGVIRSALSKENLQERRTFAIIETDPTSAVSHHRVVTHLFLEGAKALAFRPLLGLHQAATFSNASDDLQVWSGFSSQVYAPGTADRFSEELAAFIDSTHIGPTDVIFMHSLSPQIMLGAARYVSANPSTAPTFAMRLFSTAEAMAGHRLSYVKILRSIENVHFIRQKMHIFCESKGLVEYYKLHVGSDYPLLFNPEHPSLALVRDTGWFDPNLGGGEQPILAFLGEAREEKGFDDLPEILAALLMASSMQEFRFLIQTGSNYGNDTPRIERARAVLRELKAKFPGRIRSFDSVETPEQFYFLMKHVRGVIAPYKLSAYAKRGTGVILEALQMGLEVFSWAKTDIHATFKNTGQVVGVNEGASFAQTIIDHYAKGAKRERCDLDPPIAQSPKDVCRRLLSLCNQHMLSSAEGPRDAVLWVGNDTFGEGCSNVYFSQKQVLHELRRDCIELFVPWPDPNWAGVASHAYDEKIYGFGQGCEATGIAWVAQPNFSDEMQENLRQIANSGPTYEQLRNLSFEFKLADTFKKTVVNNRISHAILNYAHLYPVIEELVAPGNVICEAHDIIAYQHAIRRRDSVSLTEKIDEFTDLAQFTNIISISAQEQREIAGACGRSAVFWKLPPYIPESLPRPSESPDIADVKELSALGGVPDSVASPSPTMLRTYYNRPDLQAIFRLDSAEGRAAFFRWWVLCGQAEIANGFGLTKDQFSWLIGESDKRKGEKLSGVFKLMLSVRDDLRRSFWNGRKNVEGLQRWAREHAVQEFDTSISQLIQPDRNGAAKSFVPSGNPEACGTLRAVLDSNPIREPEFEHTLQELYDRLTDVENIDLALVGSGHLSNVTSFRWFINEVHLKYLAVKNRNLFVIGSACDALADIKHPSIFLIGRCSRVGPILRASLTCPLPVVLGSGSPIKVIPALALNGAVTVTDHIERAFKLAEYGIPAFDEPRKFADDVWALLTDKEQRVERQRRAARYVEDHLSFGGYVRFWQSLLDPLFT